MRVCGKCKVEKDESRFSKDNGRKDGLHFWCKDCVSAYSRERNQSPKIKARQEAIHYDPTPGTIIVCRTCKSKKDESEFDLSPKNRTGRSTQCKGCRAKEGAVRRLKKGITPRSEIPKLTEEEKKERAKLRQRIYVAGNREEVNRRFRERNKERRKNDPCFAIKVQLHNRLGDAVRKGIKAGSGVDDLGCSVLELKVYLETMFQPGMTWENRGHGSDKWNIDHIIPLAAFDLTNRQHVLLACNYRNLQPLWHEENMSKGDKLDWEFRRSSGAVPSGESNSQLCLV